MPLIRLLQVSKTFRAGQHPVSALQDVSLVCEDGDLLAVVGPSGSGKSTLLRVIAGLESPDTGQVYFGSRDVTHLRAEERGVGMVFQDAPVYPHLTGRENLALALRLRNVGAKDQEQRIARLVDRLRLASFLDRMPHQFSGGERHRLALARALITEAKILLLDEPLAALDAPARLELRHELRLIRREFGLTVVYVTHDQAEAFFLGNTVAIFDRGRVVQTGKPGDLYRRPANLFVARFIGNSPMNFVEGTISSEGSDTSFRARDGSIHLRVSATPANQTGRNCVLGVRPEDISIDHDATTGLTGVVESVERVGPDALVICRVDQSQIRLTARQWRSQIEPGQRCGLILSNENLCWFDPTTGDAFPE